MAFRIAVAGKGGTGKSTLAAMLCRSLLKQNTRPLLVVDADPNSCLPEKLGLKPERTMGELREELRDDPEKVPAGISKTEWIERLINQEVAEATGFDMVVMGRQEGPSCYCYINNLLRSCLDKIALQYKGVVIDNEAGLEHLSRRSNGQVEYLLVVSQATLLGARTAKRIVALVESLELDIGQAFLVLNGCNGALDPRAAAAFSETGLEVMGSVPNDDRVVEVELAGGSLMDIEPASGAAQAVDAIVSKLFKEGAE